VLELTLGSSWYAYLVRFELLSLVLLALIRLFGFAKKQDESTTAQFLALLVLLLGLFSYSAFAAYGKSLLSYGLLLPGSLFTRLFYVDIDPALRRCIEPAVLLYLLSFLYMASRSHRRVDYLSCSLASASFCLALLLEVASKAAATEKMIHDQFALAVAMHLVLIQLHFLSASIGIYFWKATNADSSKRRAPLICTLILLVSIGIALINPGRSIHNEPLVGAHYYSWFPDNWSHGFAHEHAIPPIEPTLGRYRSGTSKTFFMHKAWAEEAGIDFFVFDWWPERTYVRRRVRDAVQQGFSQKDTFQYAILYESLDLKTNDPNKGESNVVELTDEVADRMAMHWLHIARHHMSNANYLRIDNKPVLFVYASRHLVGDVRAAIEYARRVVFQDTGLRIYLVGDEVYPNVLFQTSRGAIRMKPEGELAWRRLASFDALTSYNPLQPRLISHAGSEGAEEFLRATEELFSFYFTVSQMLAIDFLPMAMPGYNDRGVRLHKEHVVVPRTVLQDSSSFEFFTQSLARWVKPYVKRGAPAFTVTSWNEWNEGTQIEPAAQSDETTFDDSANGELYLQGELALGYGCRHLEQLEQFLRALNPQNKSEANPAPG